MRTEIDHDPHYHASHERFMARWWSGEVLPWVRDDAKAAAARAAAEWWATRPQDISVERKA